MSYHLGAGTFIKWTNYGPWRIDDQVTAARLREAGITIEDFPGADKFVAPGVPLLVSVSDPGSGGMTLTLRSPNGSRSGWLDSSKSDSLRAKLPKTAGVPVISASEADAIAPLTARPSRDSISQQKDLPRTDQTYYEPRMGPEGRPGAGPVPPGAGVPPAPMPPAELPPAPVTGGAGPRRDNSKTGMYLGIGAAAVLLLVGLGVFRKGG